MLKTTVDFLRHGEVMGGTYYRGSTDDPLTQHGRKQMRQAVSEKNWDHIISSPLLRCNDFAKQLHKKTKIPITTDSDWREIHFGDWEGKMAEQINTEELMHFYQNPLQHSPNNAENFSDFISRTHLAWNNILQTHQGKHILVVTHAGVIRCLFSILLNLPLEKIFNLQIDHASITRFENFHDHPHSFVNLVFHNSNA